MKSNFIDQFFGKNANDITLEDISLYFSIKQEESGTLEFKSGEVEINDVFKEIAAFLNTEGGLLIIGSPRETKELIGKKTINYCVGEVTYSKFASKDWLHQKIFSNITPSPTDIFIKEITNAKGNLFILDIPQSSNPPHQSNADGRYYIRIDNDAKPAPHGLVQALFDKRKKPKLSAEVIRQALDANYDKITVIIRNESNVPADKVGFIIDATNINAITSSHNFKKFDDELYGLKYSCSENSAQVLVSVMSLAIEFEVLHKSKDYIISTSYWCLQSDFDCSFTQINPISNTLTSNHWLDENYGLAKALQNVTGRGV